MNKAKESLNRILKTLQQRNDCDVCTKAMCRSQANRIDYELGKIEFCIGMEPEDGSDEFVSELTEALYNGSETFYFPLSDGSLIVIDLPTGNIEVKPVTNACSKLLVDNKPIINKQRITGIVKLPTAGKKKKKRKQTGSEDIDDTFEDSIPAPFNLDEDFNGTIPLWFTLVSGHPLRPVLLFAIPGTPTPVGTLFGDEWPLYVQKSAVIIWWQDSPVEEFNLAAERALEKIGATLTELPEIDEAERAVFTLNEPFQSGLLNSNGKILEAFFEEEEQIDDELNYVPTEEEVRASMQLAKIPAKLIELKLSDDI